MSRTQVLVVWAGQSVRTNFDHGIRTQTWGFPKRVPAHDSSFDYLLFGYRPAGQGGPRQQPEPWTRGTTSLVLAQRNGDFYTGHAPHWPDELKASAVRYPIRVGMTPIATVDLVPLAPTGPLGSLGEELRLAGTSGERVASVDHSTLMELMGVASGTDTRPDLSRTPGAVETSEDRSTPRTSARAGRSSDPEFNSAVERHAVDVATHYLSSQFGWSIRELGKPYDLVCTTPDGRERHVEVKGTTGAGAEVEYTPNEVRHFRNCPYGADLVVVRDIHVDRSETPYRTSGGRLLHVPNYKAPAEDLQATGWLGRVEGW